MTCVVDEDYGGVALVALGLLFATFLVGCYFGWILSDGYWQKGLIERGYAECSATTGEWQWTDEGDADE